MNKPFLDRKQELTLLRDDLDNERPSLAIVYGRRRIGKTSLLLHLVENRPHLYYQADEVTDSVQQNDFKSTLKENLQSGSEDLLGGLTGWKSIFAFIRDQTQNHEQKFTIILDEFPYMCHGNKRLPSLVKGIWDEVQRNQEQLNLMLCGSEISFMETLLEEENPLYGRQTVELKLDPLPVREAVRFFPGWTSIQQITANGIFGGVPYYSSLCNPDESLRENIIRLVLRKGAVLYNEPIRLMKSELQNITRYKSAIRAIASGSTKWGDILNQVEDTESGALGYYLDRLQDLHLIRAERSLDKQNRHDSRKHRYYLNDPFFEFWFRFVSPHRSSLEAGHAREVYDTSIKPELNQFMGKRFEGICREYMEVYGTEILNTPPKECGKIWSSNFDIDVAGKTLDGNYFFGECKWWKNPVGENVLRDLETDISQANYNPENQNFHRLLFSRSGFTDDLQKRNKQDSHLHLITPDDITQRRT